MPVQVSCTVCGKSHSIIPSRVKNYKSCSAACRATLSLSLPNTTCTVCGKMFYAKPGHKRKYRVVSCSYECRGEHLKTAYLGKKNPNYRATTKDGDGYKLDHLPAIGRIKIHHYIMLQVLGIKKVPKGYCIHHRDCDIEHNHAENLALLSNSDHRWLHKQFGNATLWAFASGKVELDTLLSWTNNPERAAKLLPMNLLTQKESGTGGYGSTGN